MKESEEFVDRTSQGELITIKNCTYYFPENYHSVGPSNRFRVVTGFNSFTTPSFVQEDFKELLDKQRQFPNLEHVLHRVSFNKESFYPNSGVFTSTEYGYSLQIFLSDGKQAVLSGVIISDDYHTHTFSPGLPRISGFFSARDIETSLNWGMKRSWVIGADGKSAMVLVNPYAPIPFYRVHRLVFHYRWDMAEAKREDNPKKALKTLRNFARMLGLKIFSSEDFRKFQRVA